MQFWIAGPRSRCISLPQRRGGNSQFALLGRPLAQWPGGLLYDDLFPQFIARDFKEFIRSSGLMHARTSPDYPQSSGKIEPWHRSLKRECIRPLTLLTLDDSRRLIQNYVDPYNTVRLHRAIGSVTPQGMRFTPLAIASWSKRIARGTLVGSWHTAKPSLQ